MKNEQPTTAENIIEEIEPLLHDYFEGEITYCKGEITYVTPGGRKFIISAKEAK